MRNRVQGRFYFKQTSNANLLGEFSNDHSDNSQQTSTESSDLQQKTGDDRFSGSYHSTWQENQSARFAFLIIFPKLTNNRLFTLEWRDAAGQMIFSGEGMLCDDILIGDYRST
jgi:hypothetical protein